MVSVIVAVFAPQTSAAAYAASSTLASGWQLQDVAKVPQTGAQVSSAGFDTSGWYAATVPGTVLTSLVNDHVYPEPLYGENERPEIIPESLVHTSYWYRTVVRIPTAYAGRHVWLNFDGINYSAEVWVNGAQVGTMRGAFIRGIFDITAQVKPGQLAVVAVLVTPEPNPGVPHEHTLRNGVGQNGGITALDGPTFLSTIGWDWLDAVRDRDTGIWQKVFLSATGPVVVNDPLVTTDLPLPKTDSSDVTVETTVENVSDEPVSGEVRGTIENIVFSRQVDLRAPQQRNKSLSMRATRRLCTSIIRASGGPTATARSRCTNFILNSELATRSPTRRMSASAFARSATPFPAPTRSPSPSTACPSSFAAAIGASMKP